jgi:hypothetical protein
MPTSKTTAEEWEAAAYSELNRQGVSIPRDVLKLRTEVTRGPTGLGLAFRYRPKFTVFGEKKHLKSVPAVVNAVRERQAENKTMAPLVQPNHNVDAPSSPAVSEASTTFINTPRASPNGSEASTVQQETIEGVALMQNVRFVEGADYGMHEAQQAQQAQQALLPEQQMQQQIHALKQKMQQQIHALQQQMQQQQQQHHQQQHQQDTNLCLSNVKAQLRAQQQQHQEEMQQQQQQHQQEMQRQQQEMQAQLRAQQQHQQDTNLCLSNVKAQLRAQQQHQRPKAQACDHAALSCRSVQPELATGCHVIPVDELNVHADFFGKPHEIVHLHSLCFIL